MNYTATLQRLYVTKTKDSAGEYTQIGEFIVKDDKQNRVFMCYTAENAPESTDKAGKDKPVMPRVYNLFWNFTKVGVAKKNFTGVDFDKFKDIIPEVYHTRYKDYGFKNVGLQLWTPELTSFESRWIFIHRGNTGKDTAGCLLLGYGAEGNQITKSTEAIQDFYDLVYSKFENDSNRKISNFSIEVKEIQE